MMFGERWGQSGFPTKWIDMECKDSTPLTRFVSKLLCRQPYDYLHVATPRPCCFEGGIF